jgi:hypothetical protein
VHYNLFVFLNKKIKESQKLLFRIIGFVGLALLFSVVVFSLVGLGITINEGFKVPPIIDQSYNNARFGFKMGLDYDRNTNEINIGTGSLSNLGATLVCLYYVTLSFLILGIVFSSVLIFASRRYKIALIVAFLATLFIFISFGVVFQSSLNQGPLVLLLGLEPTMHAKHVCVVGEL